MGQAGGKPTGKAGGKAREKKGVASQGGGAGKTGGASAGGGGTSSGKSGATNSKGTSSTDRANMINESYSNMDPQQIKQFTEATNFDKVEVKNLYDAFMTLSPDGRVDKETFQKGLVKLEEVGLKNVAGTPFGERLFQLLDVNGDGVVDLGEFVGGLSLLCKGTPEEKLELSFKAYDLDGNGSISKEELALMFKSAWISGFRALSAVHGDEELSMEDLNEFSEEMAALFAENAFESLDVDGDNQLSFEEFKEFALAEPKITATLNGFKQEVNVAFHFSQ
jgi:Ca2+-binding EF-hand superfamily protein